MDIDKLTLSELAKLEDFMPEMGGFPSRVIAATRGYDFWVERLYKDIDEIIKNYIFTSATYRQDDKEDRYNIAIAGQLVARGYQASHDKWTNGHPDIYVENHTRGYKWTGESKIHSDYGTLLSGFKQLCERYSSGFVDQNQGAVLIVTKNININTLMLSWKKTLSDDTDYKAQKLAIDACKIDKNCFLSTHEHNVSGEGFKVRHIPISIRFQPTDKSALARKSKEKS